MKVIVIDDERLARKEMISLLESYKKIEVVDECSNVEEAKISIENNHPDLIFLDIEMPEKNGFDLLQELDDVPKVIFVTAYNDYALKAFDVNAIGYLTKPVDAAQLLHHVANLTRIHDANQHIERAQRTQVVQAFDPEVLLELPVIRNSPGALEDLIGLFRNDAEDLYNKLQLNVRKNSIRNFHENLHALKGSAANIGANRIAATCDIAGSIKPDELSVRGEEMMKQVSVDITDFEAAVRAFMKTNTILKDRS